MKEHITLCIANSVICDLASMFAGSALTRICRYHISKHLKGQLGPCVSDVMFHQALPAVGRLWPSKYKNLCLVDKEYGEIID